MRIIKTIKDCVFSESGFLAAIWILILLLIMVSTLPAHASGTDIDVGASAASTSSNSGVEMVGGDMKTFAFSYGMGDVDINDCLASVQWGTIIVGRQKVILNLWCAAEVYDAKGMTAMAAIMRCDIPEVARHFDTPESCQSANTMQPVVSIEPDQVAAQVAAIEDDHEEEVHQTQLYMAELDERMDAYEARLRRRPAPRVVKDDGYSDEQKAAVQEVLDR